MASIWAARACGVRRQPVELRAHLLLGPGPLGGDQRGVEAAVPDLPGQVADAGVAQLGGRHQLVDDPPVVRRGRRSGSDPGWRSRHCSSSDTTGTCAPARRWARNIR